MVATVWDWLKQFGKWLFDGLKFVLEGIGAFFDGIGPWITTAVQDIMQWFADRQKERDDDMRELFNEVEEAQESFFDHMGNLARWIAEQIEYVSGLNDEEMADMLMKGMGIVVKKQLAFARSLAQEVLNE